LEILAAARAVKCEQDEQPDPANRKDGLPPRFHRLKSLKTGGFPILQHPQKPTKNTVIFACFAVFLAISTVFWQKMKDCQFLNFYFERQLQKRH
jgi:hypothetical protein